MEKLKVGNIVCLKIAENIKIVITNVKDDNFQGVYFCSLTQEFKTTPMISMTVAIKAE